VGHNNQTTVNSVDTFEFVGLFLGIGPWSKVVDGLWDIVPAP